MSETERQLALQRTHRNHFLFSDYYLDNRVQDRPEWRAAAAETQAEFQEIQALWERFRRQHPGASQPNEAQTEHEWIRPVLEALGHHFNVQVSVRTPHGPRTPDYLFYPDAATRQAAPRSGALQESELRGALAVGDAKAWDRPLDQAVRLQPFDGAPKTSANPSFQIDFYMRRTGLPWGVLTNGRRAALPSGRLPQLPGTPGARVHGEPGLPGGETGKAAAAEGAPGRHRRAHRPDRLQPLRPD